MSEHFVLRGHRVVRADLMTWAKWFEKADRKVAVTHIAHATVSTVFLGLDHSFGNGRRKVFETLVFGGPLKDEMERYSTWSEAEAGHAKMVERVHKAMV